MQKVFSEISVGHPLRSQIAGCIAKLVYTKGSEKEQVVDKYLNVLVDHKNFTSLLCKWMARIGEKDGNFFAPKSDFRVEQSEIVKRSWPVGEVNEYYQTETLEFKVKA